MTRWPSERQQATRTSRRAAKRSRATEGIGRRHRHRRSKMAGTIPAARTAAALLHTVLAALKGSGSHPARRREGRANDSRQLQLWGLLAFEGVLDLIGFGLAVVVD